MHGDALEVYRGTAMGIHAGECHGSRGPEGTVMGMRPWGYMQEELRRKEEEEGGGRVGLQLKSNNPSLRGGE